MPKVTAQNGYTPTCLRLARTNSKSWCSRSPRCSKTCSALEGAAAGASEPLAHVKCEPQWCCCRIGDRLPAKKQFVVTFWCVVPSRRGTLTGPMRNPLVMRSLEGAMTRNTVQPAVSSCDLPTHSNWRQSVSCRRAAIVLTGNSNEFLVVVALPGRADAGSISAES